MYSLWGGYGYVSSYPDSLWKGWSKQSPNAYCLHVLHTQVALTTNPVLMLSAR